MCVDILISFHLKHFSFWEKFREMLSQIYIGLRVKYLVFCGQILIKLVLSLQLFKQSSSIKFCENQSSEGWVVCRQTDKHGKAKSNFSQCYEHIK